MKRIIAVAALLAFAVGAPRPGLAQDKPKLTPAEWDQTQKNALEFRPYVS